jgi:hypothetical protein
MTLYTASSGAQVFATGSMQWNWGLDDFGSNIIPDGSRVHPAVQQMTHNVLRTFSGRSTAAVTFMNTDAATSGNWTGVYGADGYLIANSPSPFSAIPAYVSPPSIQGEQVQVWANPSIDSRALLKPGSSERIASAWTTAESQNSTFTIDLNFLDANTHQVALYCTDWLGTGTVLEKIEVFEYSDSSYSNPLDTRDFKVPANGVYLVWKLSGHKIIRVTKPDATVGNKAMVSAIFFGTGP